MAARSLPGTSKCFADLLRSRAASETRRTAVLLLNSPDAVDPRLASSFLRAADVVIAGDGGLDRFRDAIERAACWEKMLATVGDFDSVSDASRDGATPGGMTLHMPSQDANDMFKCLAVLKVASGASGTEVGDGALAPAALVELAAAELGVKCEADAARCHGSPGTSVPSALGAGPQSFDVVVLGGMGGRFDHEAQSLNALVCWHTRFRSVWLVGNHSYVTLAATGETALAVSATVDGPTCGVIPIGAPPDDITTSGLRWDLGPGLKLAYGHCVSSSNHAEESAVVIRTDRPVLFTASIDVDAIDDTARGADA